MLYVADVRMGKEKVVVYGLSTEGYSIACQMAIKGADVSIIDESTPSAISLKPEIAKTYPNVSSLKEDEPLLSMEPIDLAISGADYLFFAPRIRKTGQDIKTEIHSKFKDAASSLKKNSSMVYCLPTGFGGNNENISLLEHLTGLEVGKSIYYYYYPLGTRDVQPRVIGSYNAKVDENLAELITNTKKEKKFVTVPSSEHFQAIEIMNNFSRICSILEVCRLVQDESSRQDLSKDELSQIYLDDIVNGLFDLKSLAASFEGVNTMMYMINGSIKAVDGYVKRLIDEIRGTLKKNDLKASRTKIALSWNIDAHEMRGDKIEMVQSLTAKLKDYIGDVELYDSSNTDIFHSDKTTILVACSISDYENLSKNTKDSEWIIVKANPLCEVFQ